MQAGPTAVRRWHTACQLPSPFGEGGTFFLPPPYSCRCRLGRIGAWLIHKLRICVGM